MIKPLQLALDLFGELSGQTRRPAPRPIPRDMTTSSLGSHARFVYELRRSAQRRSLSIEVHADLRVVVRAPLRFPTRDIENFVAARALWVAAQREHFRSLPRGNEVFDVAFRKAQRRADYDAQIRMHFDAK